MTKNKQFLAIREIGKPLTNKESKKCILDCRGDPRITDSDIGEIFCGSCGRVLEERLSEMESCYDFIDNTMKSTAPIPSGSKFGINTTVIGNRDGLGKAVLRDKSTFYRLKLLNNRHSKLSDNRSLRFSLILLNSLHTKLGLPDTIIENASNLYRKIMQDRITVGRNAKNLMCACVYFSCKKQGIPRSVHEISNASNLSKKEIARAYRVLVEKFGIPPIPFSPKEFVTKIAREAAISEKSQRHAIEILEIAENEKLLEGKNPKALAASALYLACMLNNERKSQSQLSKASGITTNTIRMRYCDLKMNIFEI